MSTNKTHINPATQTPHGYELLHDSSLNKGTAFTAKERDALGVRGLLPPRVSDLDTQVQRIMENFRDKPDDLEKYIFMMELQDRNETLFYRAIHEHIAELMPIIYTPTVGRACQLYGHIFRRPRGIYVSAHDRGQIASVLRNWPTKDVRVIVVTDGERILGLGDLGANGMGIPVGKLSLYTACAGVDPATTLPITIDVGTNNDELRDDPLYIGISERRHSGDEYDDLIEEFMTAAAKAFPKALIQFEDFATHNAFRLLKKYRDRARVFNDDIQGTAAVTLAGIYSALRITKQKLSDQRIVFLGAGEAGTGIGELIVAAMVAEGTPEEEARSKCWFVDSKGLVVEGRGTLPEHKRPFAHRYEALPDLMSAIRSLEPTAIVGVSGQPQTFTPEVLELMAKINEQPIVFSLSNPTSKSECTAEQAYTHTKGRAIFASGSPFDPVELDGKLYVPGQGNNAYIFPGVGLGVVASGAKHVTDAMFFAAARTLASRVTDEDLETGLTYPPLTKIREVSNYIAAAVAEVAYAEGLATEERPDDVFGHIASRMYEPSYRNFA